MCTAISISGERHLFGRTLDFEKSYGEAVVITPRNFGFDLIYQGKMDTDYAMIGIAHVSGGVPLYYDAVNERGLCAAALNFPLSAFYREAVADKQNVASFELIPFLLGRCATLDEARSLLHTLNVTPDPFSPSLPPSPLHWLVADKTGALAVEPTASGLSIYDDPFGVLTNEPDFSFHQKHLAEFMSLSPKFPKNNLCPTTPLSPYSRGMGALGLPGDFSSASRFVRAVFSKSHTRGADTVSGFFHVLDSVSVPLGASLTESGEPICTLYSSCADTDTLTYHFSTYDCRRIRSVRLDETSSSGKLLCVFPIERDEEITPLN